MIEFFQGCLGTAGLMIAVIYSMLQWFGGRDEDYLGIRARVWGRWIAPLFFSLGVIILSLIAGNFTLWGLLALISYRVAVSIGYGGNSLISKIWRRSAWALTRVAAALPFAIPAGAWELLGLQFFFALLAANVLGVYNPLKSPQEEGLINFSACFLVPFMVL